MTADIFQKKAHEFASYGGNTAYAYAGLAEEAGEVLGKYAKFIRHNDGFEPHGRKAQALLSERTRYRDDIRKELGDVLWFCAEIATVNRLALGDIMESNIAKLADRRARGVIDGSGDDR